MKIDKLFGAIFALLSVIIGAFNSHAFKKILPDTALESIDVGLRYMMYHGLALLILSMLSIEKKKWIAIFFIVGTIFFSFSIFLLSIQSIVNIQLSWLGPITPIGGSFLIFGWILLVYKFVKQKKI